MKKIFIILLCVMLIFALPIVASAEEADVVTDAQTTEVTENLPSENETTIEGEILPPEEETPITETLVEYVKEKFPEIAILLASLAMTAFISHLKTKLTASMGVMNNNAVTMATTSAEAINVGLKKMEDMASKFGEGMEMMSSLLGEIRKTAEEKESLEQMLHQVDAHLKTAKLANIEFANELAELLNLSNIPNSKKDEMYARHTQWVHELEAVEEVMSHDGTEA